MIEKLKTYQWKDKKLTNDVNEVQVEYKLIDMTDYQLNIAYTQCKQMLYNTDVINPGRMIIINQIQNQLDCINAELALRWFKQLKDSVGNIIYSETNLVSEIREWITAVGGTIENAGKYKLKDFVQVPPEFKNVNVEYLMKACRDALGYFNHSKITYPFIYRLGIYFTHKELLESSEHVNDKNDLKSRFTLLKMQLNLRDNIELKANPSGLKESEFRDMIHLKRLKGPKKCKYSELTTSQLITLRDKVLYALEQQAIQQSVIWKTLMGQIEEVAEYKGYKLD